MYGFNDLLDIIATLRSDHGCPWDRKQTLETMKECLANETEEVFQAIDGQPDRQRTGILYCSGCDRWGLPEDDPPPSPCVRRCEGRDTGGGTGYVE